MNNLTTENIISTLADAGQPMPSRAIANALGAEHIGKVRALLTELVHDETVERAKGGKYQLRDTMVHEAWPRGSSCGRETLPTDKVAIKARKKRKEKAKVVDVEPYQETDVSHHGKITTLEQAEQAADEEKARDQRIRDAIEGLKRKAKRAETNIEPVTDFHFKIEVLDGIGGTDAALVEIMREIVADLRRLQALSRED